MIRYVLAAAVALSATVAPAALACEFQQCAGRPVCEARVVDCDSLLPVTRCKVTPLGELCFRNPIGG